MARDEQNGAFRHYLQTAAVVSACLLLIAACVVLVAWFLARIYLVTMPVVVALLLSTAAVPLVRWLCDRGVPRTLAAIMVVFTMIGVVVAFGVVYGRDVSGQFGALVNAAREGAIRLRDWGADTLPLGRRQFDELLSENWERVANVGQNVLTGARAVVEFVIGAFLMFALVFFFARDGDRMFAWWIDHAPDRVREDVRAVSSAGWDTLGKYLRGSAVVALANAVGIGIGLVLIGVPLVFPLAVLTFFGGFFPIVGAVTAGLVATLIALASGGARDAWLTLAVVVGVQQLESNVLAPLVLGRAVLLHPVVIMLSITAGSLLAGVAGAFLAVPLAAVVTAMVAELRNRRSVGRGP